MIRIIGIPLMTKSPSDATRNLTAHTAGDPRAAAELMPLVYKKLRALAGSYLRRERQGHTLQPTALVHEAYIRLIDVDKIDWQGRTHFLAMAATQMRRILVEHARAHKTKKRSAKKVTLNEAVVGGSERSVDVVGLDDALDALARESPRQSRVAELRFFAGLSVKETAYVLDVSERTVNEDWRVARVWLARALERS
jgi:RNA polymerase sigma factor (TIGR02999 family)